MNERKKIGIHSFFAPLTTDQFLQDYWPSRCLVKHSSIPAPFEIGRLGSVHSFDDLLPLLDQAPSGRISFLAYPMKARKKFRSVDRSEVVEVWKKGASFCIYGFHLLDPHLIRGLLQIEKDIGILSKGSFCCGYVSAKGEVVPMHMDFTDSFVLQVAGTKRWNIAPNEQIKYTPIVWTKGLPIPREYGVKQFPKKMPPTKQTFDLKPGSVLYVPRGHWHETLATSTSISITFSLNAWAWRDLVLKVFEKRLVALEKYREPMPGVGNFQKKWIRQLETNLMSLSKNLNADLLKRIGPEMAQEMKKLLRASRKPN